MTTLKQKHTIMRWVYALRSGRYEQGIGVLQRNGRYCCLGVLAEVCAVPTSDDEDSSTGYLFPGNEFPEHQEPPPSWYGTTVGWVDAPSTQSLVFANDDDGRTFDEIADRIERTIK